MRLLQTIGVALVCVPLLFSGPSLALGAPNESNSPPPDTTEVDCIEKDEEFSLPLINSLPEISKEQIVQQLDTSDLNLNRAQVVREGHLIAELFLDEKASSPDDFQLKLMAYSAEQDSEIHLEALPVVEVSDENVQYYNDTPQYVLRAATESKIKVGHRFEHFNWGPVYSPESGTKYTEEILSATLLPPDAAMNVEQVGSSTPTADNDWRLYFQVAFTHPGIYRVDFGSRFLMGQDRKQVEVIRPLYFAVGNETINYIRTQQGNSSDLLELRPEIPPYCDEMVVPEPQPQPQDPEPEPGDNLSKPGHSTITPAKKPSNRPNSTSLRTSAPRIFTPFLSAGPALSGELSPASPNPVPQPDTPRPAKPKPPQSQNSTSGLPGPVVSAAPGIVLEQQAEPTRLNRGAFDLNQFSSVALSGSAVGLLLGLLLMGLSSFVGRRPKL